VRKLKRWKKEYNEDRPHLALKGKTPVERVRELARLSHPVKDLS
jgi:transposase InsO family protein